MAWDALKFNVLLTTLVLLLVGCGRGAVQTEPLTFPRFVGLSAFSGLSYDFPCSEYIQAMSKVPNPIMPVVYGTFGTDFSCVSNFIQLQKESIVEIHFSNEACRRNNRCYEGEFAAELPVKGYNAALEENDPAILHAIRLRLIDLVAVAVSLSDVNPAVTWILSTGLEDQFTPLAYSNLHAEIARSWPYEIIRSPLDDNALGSSLTEHHGVQVPCNTTTIASNDGDPLNVSESAAFATNHRDCKATILWQSNLQGISGEFTRPRDRTFRITSEDNLAWEAFLDVALQ